MINRSVLRATLKYQGKKKWKEKKKNKEEIYRNEDGEPLCRDCMFEDLNHYWDDDFIEDILDSIKDKFKGSYNRWRKDFYENNIQCDGEHEIEWYVPKSSITEIDGNKYCGSCIDKMEDEKVD